MAKPALEDLVTELNNFQAKCRRIMHTARIVDQPVFMREETKLLRDKFEEWGIADAFDWSDPNG